MRELMKEIVLVVSKIDNFIEKNNICKLNLKYSEKLDLNIYNSSKLNINHKASMYSFLYSEAPPSPLDTKHLK